MLFLFKDLFDYKLPLDICLNNIFYFFVFFYLFIINVGFRFFIDNFIVYGLILVNYYGFIDDEFSFNLFDLVFINNNKKDLKDYDHNNLLDLC